MAMAASVFATMAFLLLLQVGCEMQPAGDRSQLQSQPRTFSASGFQATFYATGGNRDRFTPDRVATVSATDEVWIIARPGQPVEVAADDDTPGSGAMLGLVPVNGEPDAEPRRIPLPLKHTDVTASIAGFLCTVDVTQQFHNPFDSKIEAVYVFPLPQDAAVNDFVMTIGDRRIRGVIREKEEAERIYREAKAQGYRAALMTQQRPNVFTQKVANIEPGKRIDVEIRYFNTLSYSDGWYQFVFPTVVGPRFNPPGVGDGVGAVPRGGVGNSGQSTDVSYLRPSERSGHDIAIEVDVEAGAAIREIVSPTHRIAVAEGGDARRTVRLASDDRIPNKDFVLRYRVGGERISTHVVTHEDERGGFFAMMLYPPESSEHLQRQPMEVVFVLDCSGSMRGEPMRQARDAAELALRRMNRDDTFQIIRFSNSASQLGPRPIRATPENIREGIRYLRSLDGGGGTHMIEGIKAALDFPHDDDRLRYVCFMTDGYIGNDRQIIGEVTRRVGASRIFSFGVGSSTNRYLLHRMAKQGRGAAAFLLPGDDAETIMDLFWDRVTRPALTDVEVDFGGARVTSMFPRTLPDLFTGRPIIVTGRYTGEMPNALRVTGRVGGERVAMNVRVSDRSDNVAHQALPSVWARMNIAALSDQMTFTGDDDGELSGEIRRLALRYRLMSDYTSFIAVDASEATAGEYGTTVHQSVPVPAGVRYETTVTE